MNRSLLIGFLLFSLESLAGAPTSYEVIMMKTYPECKELLERSISANKNKDLEILDLKNRVMQLELLVIEMQSTKKK